MRLGKVLGPARFLAIVAVVGLLATSIATFGWSVARTVLFIDDLFAGKWRSDDQVVSLLKTIDTYLLALVQFIIVVGLYELFIGELDVPEWLRIQSLDDLKGPIIDILVVFVAVKAIEGLLKQKDPLDALTFVGAAASLILVLTVFRLAKGTTKK
ncbi:MAG: YqhA family protein [Actinobacteria bacterium]|nr:YqhA family protein [Actinomycetota bacterium]